MPNLNETFDRLINRRPGSAGLPSTAGSNRAGDRQAWPSSSQKGQSLVELALTVTLLVFLLLAILDFGLGFFTWIALRDAAQEGAAYGSIYPPVDPDTTRNQPEIFGYSLPFIRARVRFASDTPADLYTIPNSQIEIKILDANGNPGGIPCPGNAIRVTVTYHYRIVGPMIAEFIGSPTIPISATATDTILMKGNNAACP